VDTKSKSEIKFLEKFLRTGLHDMYNRYKNSCGVKRYRDDLKKLARPYDAFLSCDAVEVERIARKSIVDYLATWA
jgi:hypothetical protein